MNTPQQNPSPSIRVLIADDHLVVRQGIRALLQAPGAEDMELVGEAETGRETARLCGQTLPDIVLLDWRMPLVPGQAVVDGVETMRLIQEASPRTRIVILTSFDGTEHVLPALRAGAFSYLLKDVGADDLLRALRRAAQGEPTLHPQAVSVLMHSIGATGGGQPAKNASQERPAWSQLTPREMEVLGALSEGLSNGEMAVRFVLSEKTIKAHVSSIFAKLDVADRTQAAVYAWRHGLQTRETTPDK